MTHVPCDACTGGKHYPSLQYTFPHLSTLPIQVTNTLSINSLSSTNYRSEIVSLIEATGAMGLYHEGYAAVSKKASVDYLDRCVVC